MKKKLLIFGLAACGLNVTHAQVFYSENFESGNGSQWNFVDRDKDNKKFAVLNASSINAAVFGTKSLVSYSYQSVALTPDNLAISPAIALPGDVSNLFLSFNVWSYQGSYGAEHYAVYLTESADPEVIAASIPVKEETLEFTGGLKEVSVDVSAYKGKTVYLTFRHFNCTDQNFMILDNLQIGALSENNAGLNSVALPKFILKNTDNDLSVTVKNKGSNVINSVEINWNDGADHIATVPANIPVGATATLIHPAKLNYSAISEKNISVSVTKVNGTTDSDLQDNSGSASTHVSSQIVPKKVVFEEGTGTWCGWCTRGIVALDVVNQQYPEDQISIAVHNGDPMVFAPYNSGAGFSSFPGMTVDRELKGVDISPSTIGNYVETRRTLPTAVQLGGTYSIDGSALTANVSAQFFTNFSTANYRLAAVVTEDDVHGTASGYRQANYYAGGAYGPMGGFENMPSMIPAAQMYYDHVGRALLGGYAGQDGSVPAVIADQQVVQYSFNYSIPTGYVADKLHVVLFLIDQTNGTIVNAAKLTKAPLAVSDVSAAKNTTVYPNPAKSDFNIKFAKDGKYDIVIYDMSGKMAANFGRVSVNDKVVNLPIKLLPGKYFVNISQDGVSYTKELLVQ